MIPASNSSSAALGAGLQTGLVSDPSSYQALEKSAKQGGQAGLESAARAFEALMVGQMLKQMRSASFGDGIFDSEQTKLYQDLYDQQIASVISQGDGMGIRKALLRQLAPQFSEHPDERDQGSSLRVPERNTALRSFLRHQVDAGSSADSGSVEKVASGIPEGVPASAIGQSTGQWPPAGPEDFVAYLKPYADRAAEALGMDTSILLAQSALETGWGKHVPRHADGSSSFNLFGIKADRSWEGDRVSVGTLEYRNGVAQRERAKFRAYEDPADSFVDYVAFLRRNPRYREALGSTNAEDFIRGLQAAGYATDPSYASKVLGIRNRVMALGAAVETQVSANMADSPNEG
ncbi:flagellar rod assembly protein/muramidase FlgJ [Thiorhodococcus drewsii AZ1]|uniref:Peptidoglycan hydrolase FlgJ n=1 Tax=Thiorhodococcus drewsii AZ1 TaxID=765913 RepID=G2E374_9GAMM|nr:flagellar assembly peptidoglycan hydrolase FlgJ [Thiorhodococcus drewsii]EGV30536.1 flagellar rod assembly protein/muramidase FlgJ [Thiorhodococcus drewsii AZ1]